MKNPIIKILFLALIISCPWLSLMAYDFVADGIYYNIIDEDAACVEVTYESPKAGNYVGDIVIPASVEYNGKEYTVNCLGEYALGWCNQLTSLSLPETLKKIRTGAMCHCPAIEHLSIPDGVVYIEASAFSYCSALKSISLPNRVKTVSDYLFANCSSLEYVYLPDIVYSIGQRAFDGCESLKFIKICDLVQTIPVEAFRGCASLGTITIPAEVTSIEWGAFKGCTSLKEVKTGDKLETINEYAFAGCTALEKFTCMAPVPPVCKWKTDGSFNDTNIANATLVIPEGSLESYESTIPWANFGNFEEVQPLPTMLIEKLTRVKTGDYSFKVTCTVKCTNANRLYVSVEEDYDTNLRVYTYNDPTEVEVETGNITTLDWSIVTFKASNKSGATVKTFEFDPEEIPMAEGLYYAGTDGMIYHVDNEGNTTAVDTKGETFPHTFNLLQVGNRIYGASAGDLFTYNPQAEGTGDGKVFYLSSRIDGEKVCQVVFDNTYYHHDRDPYGLAAYNDEVYFYDRNQSVRKFSTDDKSIDPRRHPSWLENGWLSFYGNGWAYGCVKSGMQITELVDDRYNREPIYWLSVYLNGNGIFRFKEEAIGTRTGFFGNSTYNNTIARYCDPHSFYIDEVNDHIYVFSECRGKGGLYRMKFSDVQSGYGSDFEYCNRELIDGSPVLYEGTENEHVSVPQLSADANGEYLYWCYRAPTSQYDYDSNIWYDLYDPADPLHHTGIKRIKLGEANPEVDLVVPDAEGYGLVAVNFAPLGFDSINETVSEDTTDGPVEYFNLQGIHIDTPSRGSVVIRRRGSRADKIVF